MNKTKCYTILTIFILMFGCESSININDNSNYPYSSDRISSTELINQIEQFRLENPKRNAEMHFHRISENVSGFGGFYFDTDENFVIVLTPDAPVDLARSFVAREIRSQLFDVDESSMVIKEGRFTFDELSLWRELVTAFVLANEAFSFVRTNYVNEQENRIVVGIDEFEFTDQNIDRVGDFIVNWLDIPLDAIKVEKATNLELSSWSGNLNSKTRPLIGGLGIHRGATSGGNCTMGFIGLLDGHEAFITNSHCTSVKFGLDNTVFFQGWTASENIVGTEYKDPNTSWCGVWPIWQSFYNCRNSDASAIKINQGVQSNKGLIARTTFKNSTGAPGSTIINESNPVFSIARSNDFIAMGTTVSKVGRSTGWTEGIITKTCVDKHSAGGAWILKCQYGANYYEQGGDSGSPVFRIIYDINGNPHASLYGIHYGKDSSTSYFSPMSGIRSDLGNISANDPNSTFVPIPPFNGGGGIIIDDPCVENPINCHQP